MKTYTINVHKIKYPGPGPLVRLDLCIAKHLIIIMLGHLQGNDEILVRKDALLSGGPHTCMNISKKTMS